MPADVGAAETGAGVGAGKTRALSKGCSVTADRMCHGADSGPDAKSIVVDVLYALANCL